ncbi:DUF7504 family protein [Haladaptatus sp. NG-SE-30]
MQQVAHETTNTLLQAPAFDTDAEAEIFDVLSQSSPSKRNVLIVSYRQGPDAWLADWRTHVGQFPADLGFVHVGETTRSAAAQTTGATRTPGAIQSPGKVVSAIGDPADLTGLGIQISEYLERWAHTDNQIVVYLDSLTALLQFVDINRVYRFLHVLGGRITSVDGHAYYRLDPDAHKRQTIAILESLMDAAIDIDHLHEKPD